MSNLTPFVLKGIAGGIAIGIIVAIVIISSRRKEDRKTEDCRNAGNEETGR